MESPNLESYLKTATRGLWGKRKYIVTQELRGNLAEIRLEYQLQGMTQIQSLELALQDFGTAKKLNAQLLEVHLMPTIYKTSLLTFIAATLFVAAVSSAAPLTTTNTAPLPDCSKVGADANINGAFNCAFNGTWIRLSELQRELETNGGAVTLENNQLRMRFAGDSAIIEFSVKNPEPIVIPGLMPEYTYHQFFSFKQAGETFISVYLIIGNIVKQSKLPVQLSGWDNPSLQVGKTKIAIGNGENPFNGSSLYNNGLGNTLEQLLPDRSIAIPGARILSVQYYSTMPQQRATYPYEQHRIEVPEDGIYAIVSQNVGKQNKGTFEYTIGKSNNRILETYLSSDKVTFVDSLQGITGTANELEQNVILLKLTGNLSQNPYVITVPKKLISQAILR